MFDVVALGESLIDFTPNGTNAQGIELFARNPGGAPANVLAMNAHTAILFTDTEKSAKTDLAIFFARPLWKAALMCPVW